MLSNQHQVPYSMNHCNGAFTTKTAMQSTANTCILHPVNEGVLICCPSFAGGQSEKAGKGRGNNLENASLMEPAKARSAATSEFRGVSWGTSQVNI